MYDSNPFLEDQSVGWAPLRFAAFYLVVLPLSGLLLVTFVALLAGRISLLQFFLLLLFPGVPGYFLCRWLWKRLHVTVTYTLIGSVLKISKSYEDKTSVRAYPKQYDLDSLWAAQMTEQWSTNNNDQVSIFPAKLILVFDPRDGSVENQVTLRRPRVEGAAKDQAALFHQLDGWNKLCAAVQSRVLPQALAPRWAAANSHLRYWMVILQAELEFLQGRSTAPQMCLATVRIITSAFGEAGTILKRAFIWSGVFYLVFGGVAWGSLWLLGVRFFVDESDRLNSRSLLILGFAALASVVYGLLFSFKPLSAQLQKAASVRENQAQRLVDAGAQRDDFDPILAFLKNEVDHVQHRLATLTVATGLPILLTLLPRFFTDMSSRTSNIILIISLAAFALVQLYFYAQIQILHLAQTSCLIAQSELPKNT